MDADLSPSLFLIPPWSCAPELRVASSEPSSAEGAGQEQVSMLDLTSSKERALTRWLLVSLCWPPISQRSLLPPSLSPVQCISLFDSSSLSSAAWQQHSTAHAHAHAKGEWGGGGKEGEKGKGRAAFFFSFFFFFFFFPKPK